MINAIDNNYIKIINAMVRMHGGNVTIPVNLLSNPPRDDLFIRQRDNIFAIEIHSSWPIPEYSYDFELKEEAG